MMMRNGIEPRSSPLPWALRPATIKPTDRDGRRMRDCDIRPVLHAELQLAYRDDPSTLIMDELGLRHGESRVDVAVINGRLIGYEIKSDADTLDRLPGQIELYGQVLDRVTLVCGARHMSEARKLIPRWWGLDEAVSDLGGVVLREIRPPRDNPRPKALAIAELLWRDEAVALLDPGGKDRSIGKLRRDELYKLLATTWELTELRGAVRAALKARVRWRMRSVLPMRPAL